VALNDNLSALYHLRNLAGPREIHAYDTQINMSEAMVLRLAGYERLCAIRLAYHELVTIDNSFEHPCPCAA
jgi:hypothetical protein